MKERQVKPASATVRKKPALLPKFDTMAAMNTLTKAGIEQRPAGAIVGVVRDAQCELVTEESLLSTKFALESGMTMLKSGLRADMAELRVELRSEMAELKIELKSEMSELREELKSDMAGLREDIKSDMAGLREDIKSDMAGLREEVKVGLKSDIKNLEVNMEKQFAQLYRYLLVGGGASITAIVGLLGVMMILTGGDAPKFRN